MENQSFCTLADNLVCIGVDQSYANTGISVVSKSKLKSVRAIELSKLKNNSEKRLALAFEIKKTIDFVLRKNQHAKIIIIIERVRVFSQGVLAPKIIRSLAMLDSVIIDVAYFKGVEVFSVDTRCWKSKVIGTSKPQNNKFGVDPRKYPTIKWCIKKGLTEKLLIEIKSRKTKNTFVDPKNENRRLMFDTDKADSIAIAFFGFFGDKKFLQKEN